MRHYTLVGVKTTSVTYYVYSPTGWRVQREREERVPERVVYCNLQLTGQPQQTVVIGQFTVTRSGTHGNVGRWLHRPGNVTALLRQLMTRRSWEPSGGRKTHRLVVVVRERTEMPRVRPTGSKSKIDDVKKSHEQMAFELGRRNCNKNNIKQAITLTINNNINKG